MRIQTLFTVAWLGLSSSIFAQGYPKIPKAEFAAAKARAEAADQLSDERFAAALPTIEAWSKRGKPYLPAAERPADLPQAKIPAFPGAEGGGMYSFGGRGGKVIVVTNLNDDGPGSFRHACEQAGPRIVVFNVTGIIRLKDRVRVRAPYITIAGNTAPAMVSVSLATRSNWRRTTSLSGTCAFDAEPWTQPIAMIRSAEIRLAIS